MRMIFIFIFLIFMPFDLKSEKLNIYVTESFFETSESLLRTWRKDSQTDFNLKLIRPNTFEEKINNLTSIDLIILEDTRRIKWIEEKKPETMSNPIAKNSLVLVTNINEGFFFDEFHKDDFLYRLSDSHFTISNPINNYLGYLSKEVLISLNIWTDVRENLVLNHSNLKNLKYLERSFARVGIAYYSEVIRNPHIRIIHRIDEELHNNIIPTYRAITFNQKKTTIDFFEWLKGVKADKIIRSYGFLK